MRIFLALTGTVCSDNIFFTQPCICHTASYVTFVNDNSFQQVRSVPTSLDVYLNRRRIKYELSMASPQPGVSTTLNWETYLYIHFNLEILGKKSFTVRLSLTPPSSSSWWWLSICLNFHSNGRIQKIQKIGAQQMRQVQSLPNHLINLNNGSEKCQRI